VWRADPTGALLTDMPAWRQLTGGTDDVRGEAWLSDVHPEDQARVLSTWMRCVREERFYDVEYRIRTQDGWRRIRSRGAPLRAPHGEVLEWIGTTDDVTAEHLAIDRALALQRIGEALVGAATVADVEDVILGLVRDTVQARAVVFGLLRAETGAIPLRAAGYPEDLGIDDVDGRRLPLLTEVIRTGRARFIPDARTLRTALNDVAGQSRTAALFENVTGAGDVSWCMLPLISRGTPSGGITLGFDRAHVFDASERTFLLTLAANCAIALQRAQLFEEQRTVATVLQRALQPLVVEQPAFGRAWVEQRTAAGADVGGDWAEVLPLGQDAAAIVLGDVMGRGVRAARMMAETRAAVRTLATLDPDPRFVLDGLDRIFASQGLDEIVTLFYGVLRVDGSLRCISAGHLPPLVVPGTGAAAFLEVPATPPLGVPCERREVHTCAVRSGDAIVLFSDGLVESRVRSVGDGLDALCAAAHSIVASETARQPQLLCAHLIEQLLDGGESDDDVTLLALQLD
ncbi:MAG: hypothetical protein JWM93_3481, partial [Frankiales bacterium]|nr:hypothetical protein [Frankiales bacterium]